MINGSKVRPEKWENVLDLYDDGEISFIIGNYENDSNKSIAVRWNGYINNADDIGYPRQGVYPTWFILPEFLNNAILAELIRDQTNGILENIKKAFTDIN